MHTMGRSAKNSVGVSIFIVMICIQPHWAIALANRVASNDTTNSLDILNNAPQQNKKKYKLNSSPGTDIENPAYRCTFSNAIKCRCGKREVSICLLQVANVFVITSTDKIAMTTNPIVCESRQSVSKTLERLFNYLPNILCCHFNSCLYCLPFDFARQIGKHTQYSYGALMVHINTKRKALFNCLVWENKRSTYQMAECIQGIFSHYHAYELSTALKLSAIVWNNNGVWFKNIENLLYPQTTFSSTYLYKMIYFFSS